MNEIVIRIQVPEGVTVSVDYETPQEPPHMAEMPPIGGHYEPATTAPTTAALVQQAVGPIAGVKPDVPSCPTHGPMTYHAAKTKPDGKQVSARYSCDNKINDRYCPTRPVWL